MCVFTNSMATYLSNSYISQYPIDLLTIGDTSQNTYPLARKLAMNFTMLRNVSRGTNDILKVSRLMENTPDIPSIEEVNKGNRAWRSRRQDKLEKRFDELEEKNIIKWEYCNAGKEPLTKTQYEIPDYNRLSNSLRHYL